ncbi:MAG: AraC-like DNA-binding protein/disulfide bond formation protein DsbB [Saprospiraceae bacterium]
MKGQIIFIAAIIGVVVSFSAIVYWRKKSSHKSFLSLLTLTMMMQLLNMLVVANYGDTDHPVVNLFSLLFFVNLLLIPPSMYLYVKQYLGEKTIIQILQENIKHYFPAIALFVVNISSFVIIYRQGAESDIGLMIADVMTYSNLIALFFIFLLQNIFYIYSAFKRYNNHLQNVSESFSFTDGIIYPWIRIFIIGYTLFIIALYLQTMGIFGGQNWSLALIIGLYVSYMLYNGLQFPSFAEVVAQANTSEKDKAETGSQELSKSENIFSLEKENKKEIKTNIPIDLQEKIWERIEQLMSKEKLYLDKELTVYTLAKAAETNSKYLRYTINNKFEKNFAGYVNNYRIEKAKALLVDAEQDLYNIEYIGEMAGFKSKSAFYTAFKKQTRLTPQAYRKEKLDS